MQNKAFANAYVEAAEQALEAAKGKEAEVLKSYEEQQKLAMDLNVRVAEFATMNADLIRATKLCDVLDDRIKELSVTEDSGALNITILEVARAEPLPTKPQKTRIMAMALALGLMMGMGLALLRDWTDQRLRSPEEISALLDCPVLGVVPHMTGKTTLPERGQCVRLEQKSDVAEAYRTIRTAVYFGLPAGKAKTLLVTSPAPGDGKSTMISNLATAMAQAGQRVLVIDGDFRRPTQHKIFEADDEVGLSTVMCGRAKVQEAIAHTTLKNLDLLVCGPIPPNPSELLNSQEFGDLVKQLSEQYDHILIDSPPVMPVTDARILGALCDVTILVLRAEKSTRKASQMALEGLLSVGANILGVVVNDISRSRGRYGYYSGYGYYSYGYYGHDDNGNGNGHGRRAKALTHTPARTTVTEETEA